MLFYNCKEKHTQRGETDMLELAMEYGATLEELCKLAGVDPEELED